VKGIIGAGYEKKEKDQLYKNQGDNQKTPSENDAYPMLFHILLFYSC